jgi:hypothetical protein
MRFLTQSSALLVIILGFAGSCKKVYEETPDPHACSCRVPHAVIGGPVVFSAHKSPEAGIGL